jgi:hypothetical protein
MGGHYTNPKISKQQVDDEFQVDDVFWDNLTDFDIWA